MATTYTLISSNVLSSDTSSITFSSIPQTYTDLNLVASIRSSTSAAYTVDSLVLTFNNTFNVYEDTNIRGTGSAASSGNQWGNNYQQVNDWTANGGAQGTSTFSNTEVYIPNYTSSTQKQYSVFGVTENNATASYMRTLACLFKNTSAISSIVCQVQGTPIAAGSSFYLYGIKNS